MLTLIARFISILGHPALLMPVAAAIASAASGDHRIQILSIFIAIFFGLLVYIYTYVKTKSGKWVHVDASNKSERKELNLTAAVTLFISAVILALFKVHFGIVLAISLSGAIVIVSHFFSRVAKPSLHVSFAVFAACLTLPSKIAFLTILSFAIFIGWARLHLERHTPIDLVIGVGLGFSAGVCFQVLVRFL